MCLAQIAFQFYLYPYVNSTRLHSPSDLLYTRTTAIWGESQLSRHWSRYLYLITRGARPPRGRFSHLAMFRLGTLLFIPGYTTVTLYRVLAGPESGSSLLLMIRRCFSRYFCRSMLLMRPSPIQSLDNQHVSGLQISSYRSLIRSYSAVRYCGATFTFTSVSVLLNYSKQF